MKHRLLFAALASAAVWALCTLYMSFTAPHAPPSDLPAFLSIPRPILLSHRGSRYLTAENTVQAHQLALGLGSDVLEMDVRLTKDGVVVVHHDEDVARTTESVGKIHEMTLQEIRALDAAYDYSHDNGVTYPMRGQGHVVPTLKEILEAFPNQSINIEVKRDCMELAKALVDVIREAMEDNPEADYENHIVVCSSHCGPIHYVQESGLRVGTANCAPEVSKLMVAAWLNLGPLVKLLHAVYPLQMMKADVVQIPVRSGKADLSLPGIMDFFHFLGKKVHYWVVNDPDQMRHLLRAGADGIITDRTDIARRVFEELGIVGRLDGEPLHPYYIPHSDPIEQHTCVSLICIINESVDPYVFILGAYAIVLSLVVLVTHWLYPSRRSAREKTE